eukprot:TRINITY_DN2620_c0_g1_i1.p1 TRINITY_DN2620_c0_g1~~TRINITY_DN2620_c0_g1_i1.p1  ORF type:complete len:229 (-),score=62.12 TRINITY_DN2620_c0_g1_i1:380-1066(-)
MSLTFFSNAVVDQMKWCPFMGNDDLVVLSTGITVDQKHQLQILGMPIPIHDQELENPTVLQTINHPGRITGMHSIPTTDSSNIRVITTNSHGAMHLFQIDMTEAMGVRNNLLDSLSLDTEQSASSSSAINKQKKNIDTMETDQDGNDPWISKWNQHDSGAVCIDVDPTNSQCFIITAGEDGKVCLFGGQNLSNDMEEPLMTIGEAKGKQRKALGGRSNAEKLKNSSIT